MSKARTSRVRIPTHRQFRINNLPPAQYVETLSVEKRKSLCKQAICDSLSFYRATVEIQEAGLRFDATVIKESVYDLPHCERDGNFIYDPPVVMTQIVADAPLPYFANCPAVIVTAESGEIEGYRVYNGDSKGLLIKV